MPTSTSTTSGKDDVKDDDEEEEEEGKSMVLTEGLGERQINSLKSLEWRFSDQKTRSHACVYGPIQIQLSYALSRSSPVFGMDSWVMTQSKESFVMLTNISTWLHHSCHISLQSSNFKFVKAHPLTQTGLSFHVLFKLMFMMATAGAGGFCLIVSMWMWVFQWGWLNFP